MRLSLFKTHGFTELVSKIGLRAEDEAHQRMMLISVFGGSFFASDGHVILSAQLRMVSVQMDRLHFSYDKLKGTLKACEKCPGATGDKEST